MKQMAARYRLLAVLAAGVLLLVAGASSRCPTTGRSSAAVASAFEVEVTSSGTTAGCSAIPQVTPTLSSFPGPTLFGMSW